MKVLILSWEYPPRNIGEVSTHVYNLSHSLKNIGHDVHVITCGNENTFSSEDDNGVMVHRVEPYNIPTNNLIEWVNHLNYAILEKSVKLINQEGKFDLIHAHDWLVAFAGKTLKECYTLPLVTSLHSTENDRNCGIHNDLQRYIDSVEKFLVNESNKVICCNDNMRNKIYELFNYGVENIEVVPYEVSAEFTSDVYLEVVPKKKKATAKKVTKKSSTGSKKVKDLVEDIKETSEVKKTRKRVKKTEEKVQTV